MFSASIGSCWIFQSFSIIYFPAERISRIRSYLLHSSGIFSLHTFPVITNLLINSETIFFRIVKCPEGQQVTAQNISFCLFACLLGCFGSFYAIPKDGFRLNLIQCFLALNDQPGTYVRYARIFILNRLLFNVLWESTNTISLLYYLLLCLAFLIEIISSIVCRPVLFILPSNLGGFIERCFERTFDWYV